jgi:uncharacterized protein (DUF1330 family)
LSGGKSLAKATIIIEGRFREGYEQQFAEYSRTVRAYIDKHGAEVVRRQRVRKMLYGSDPADLFMVIDFPSAEIAESIFFEPEYLAIIALRDRIFSSFKMYVADYGNI